MPTQKANVVQQIGLSSWEDKLQCWKLYQETNDYLDYLSLRYKTATKFIRRSKRKLERKIAKNIKMDPKAFYKYSRSKVKTRETIGPFTDQYGQLINNDSQTADMLNKYSPAVFTEGTSCNMPYPRLLFHGDESQFVM